MRVALKPEEVRALCKPNERPWTADEVKPHVEVWLPWFQASGVLQMFHAPCARSNLAVRIFLPAAALPALGKNTAWTQEAQLAVDAHIKAGYIMIEQKEVMPAMGASGLLFVDLNVLLNTAEAEKLSTARYLVLIFPKCAKCHTLLKPELPLKACSKCGLIYYCNEGCESAHLPWHAAVCMGGTKSDSTTGMEAAGTETETK